MMYVFYGRKLINLKCSNFHTYSFQMNDIEMLTGERVTKLDTEKKIVFTNCGKEFPYDKVFISVGVK